MSPCPDDYAERIAMIENCTSIPAPWSEALARICTCALPSGYEQAAWDRVVDDAARLIEKWHSRLTGNGWGPADIRVLLPLISGREVMDVGRGDVTVQAMDGTTERLFRRPSVSGAATWAADRRAA